MPVVEDVRNRAGSKAVGSPSNALDDGPHLSGASDRPIVLLIDDDPILLVTFADMLGRGYRVVTAGNGADAVAIFQSTAVDVVVTDLAMPGMNGLQVASRCKMLRPAVPVVMVTAWEALVGPDDAAGHGIDRILTKPLRAATLVRAIQDLMS